MKLNVEQAEPILRWASERRWGRGGTELHRGDRWGAEPCRERAVGEGAEPGGSSVEAGEG